MNDTEPHPPPRKFRISDPSVDEDAPAWWNAYWDYRQRSLRALIAQQLRRAGRPMATTELRSRLTSFAMVEIQHAIDVLVSRGVLVKESRVEVVRGGRGLGREREFQYFGLSE